MPTDPIDDLFIQKKPSKKALYLKQSVAWWKQYHVPFNLAMAIISLVVLSLISHDWSSVESSWFEDIIAIISMSTLIMLYSNLIYLVGFLIDLLFALGFKRPLIHKYRLLVLGIVVCFMLLCFFLLYSVSLMPV